MNLKNVGNLEVGEEISITEKVDGANGSFTLDIEGVNGVSCYSRRMTLNEYENLSGFYQWVQKNIVPQKSNLNPKYRYFGEYVLQHKALYKPEIYNNFYLFSIWDEELEEYLTDKIVKEEAKKLHLNTVPYFYEGPFISIEHIESFIGKSDLTAELNTGEGIVVKNINFRDKYGKQQFIKLVDKSFKEKENIKTSTKARPDEILTDLVKSVLTVARVEKLIFNLIDDGKLERNLQLKNMGVVLRALGSSIVDDIMKEESELFREYDVILVKEVIGKKTPKIVKAIFLEGNIFN